jgi:glucose/arabinose dehydrogenase
VILDGIPVGEHRVDSLVVGPGGRLYLGVGSETDRDAPTSRLSAAVISFRPDGSGVRVEASGLRNPFGLARIPGTSVLLVTDEGIDFTGDRPPDELNALNASGPARDFGFPRCYDQGGAACAGTVAPLARLAPHAAAGGVAVSPGFGRFGSSAYVAEYGSSPGFGTHPTGADIVRVPLPAGRVRARATARPFATGFHHPDPLGLAFGPDAALYPTLWSSGSVVRIAPAAASVGGASGPTDHVGASLPAIRTLVARMAKLVAAALPA